jgi:hypothetical protein
VKIRREPLWNMEPPSEEGVGGVAGVGVVAGVVEVTRPAPTRSPSLARTFLQEAEAAQGVVVGEEEEEQEESLLLEDKEQESSKSSVSITMFPRSLRHSLRNVSTSLINSSVVSNTRKRVQRMYREHKRRVMMALAVSCFFLWALVLITTYGVWAPLSSPQMCYPRTFPEFEETSCRSSVVPLPGDPTKYKVRCGTVRVHEDQSNCQQKRFLQLYVVVVRKSTLSSQEQEAPLAIYGTSMEAGAVNFSQELLRIMESRELVFISRRGSGLAEPTVRIHEAIFESAWQMLTNRTASVQDHLERMRRCAVDLIGQDIRPSAYDRVQASFDVWNVRLALDHPVWYVLSVGSLSSEVVSLYHRHRDPVSCLNVSYLAGTAPSQLFTLQATENMEEIARVLGSKVDLQQAFQTLQQTPDNTSLLVHDSGLFRTTQQPPLPPRMENVQMNGRTMLWMLYNGMKMRSRSRPFSLRFSETLRMLADPLVPMQSVFPLNSIELELYKISFATDWPFYFSSICTKGAAVSLQALLSSDAFDKEAIRWNQWMAATCSVWPTSRVHGFENEDPGVIPVFSGDGVLAKSRATNGRLDPESNFLKNAKRLSFDARDATKNSRDFVSMDWNWYGGKLNRDFNAIQESAFGVGPQSHPNTLLAHEMTSSYGLFEADKTWKQIAQERGALV